MLENHRKKVILRCNRGAKVCDMFEALQFMSVKERIDMLL